MKQRTDNGREKASDVFKRDRSMFNSDMLTMTIVRFLRCSTKNLFRLVLQFGLGNIWKIRTRAKGPSKMRLRKNEW